MLLGIDIPYTVKVVLYDGATQVTDRVAAEPDRYQIFLTGRGFEGPSSAADPARVIHTYDDDALGIEKGGACCMGSQDLGHVAENQPCRMSPMPIASIVGVMTMKISGLRTDLPLRAGLVMGLVLSFFGGLGAGRCDQVLAR